MCKITFHQKYCIGIVIKINTYKQKCVIISLVVKFNNNNINYYYYQFWTAVSVSLYFLQRHECSFLCSLVHSSPAANTLNKGNRLLVPAAANWMPYLKTLNTANSAASFCVCSPALFMSSLSNYTSLQLLRCCNLTNASMWATESLHKWLKSQSALPEIFTTVNNSLCAEGSRLLVVDCDARLSATASHSQCVRFDS